jgi:hypothetical protein
MDESTRSRSTGSAHGRVVTTALVGKRTDKPGREDARKTSGVRLFPVHCDTCGRSCLAAIEAGTTRCRWCEGPARVVPGANYGPGDVPLFQEVEEAVHAAGVDRDVAIRLLADLAWAWPESSPARLSLLDNVVPFLSAAFRVASPVDHKLLEGMAITVLDGIASTRAPHHRSG